jgi:carbonic anhydrase
MHNPPSFDQSRRRLMAALALTPLATVGLGRASFAAKAAASQITGDAARARLVAGNARYVAGNHLRVDHSSRREAVAPAQLPFAIVLGCSDSRVPPEILFDQGLGDVFTVRVAGNIADDGAVSATVDAVAAGATVPPHIASLVAAIRPAVEASKGMPGNAVENAIATHIRLTVAALKASGPVLADAVTQGHLTIVGAEYHLATGHVVFMA